MKNRVVELKQTTVDLAPWLLIALVFTLYHQFFASFVSGVEHPDEPAHLAYIQQVVAGVFRPIIPPAWGAAISTIPHFTTPPWG